jgi:hypothetical protein
VGGALGPFAASGLRGWLGLGGAFVAVGGVLLAAGMVAGVLPSKTLGEEAES